MYSIQSTEGILKIVITEMEPHLLSSTENVEIGVMRAESNNPTLCAIKNVNVIANYWPAKQECDYGNHK